MNSSKIINCKKWYKPFTNNIGEVKIVCIGWYNDGATWFIHVREMSVIVWDIFWLDDGRVHECGCGGGGGHFIVVG